MTIRHSTYDDIPRILKIYEASRAIMRSDGNMTQWAGGYPSEDIIKKDIERGVGYVIEEAAGPDGPARGPVGAFAFIQGVDPTYLKIEGEWLDDTLPYGTIHRLGSFPDVHGIAKACFDWCCNVIPNVRVDTHADNRIMQHCIAKAGFKYCGVIYIADGTPRNAYQKLIS